MGCYGRRGPRVSQFGSVATWALEHTPYQARLRTDQNLHVHARVGESPPGKRRVSSLSPERMEWRSPVMRPSLQLATQMTRVYGAR